MLLSRDHPHWFIPWERLVSKDINLVAVCIEKMGRPINQPRQRARDRERETRGEGTMGSHQGRAPTAAKPRIPALSHVHQQTCAFIYICILSMPPPRRTHTYAHKLFSSSHTCTPVHLKGGQLSRCSATSLYKGCKWLAEKEKNVPPDSWVSTPSLLTGAFFCFQYDTDVRCVSKTFCEGATSHLDKWWWTYYYCISFKQAARPRAK